MQMAGKARRERAVDEAEGGRAVFGAHEVRDVRHADGEGGERAVQRLRAWPTSSLWLYPRECLVRQEEMAFQPPAFPALPAHWTVQQFLKFPHYFLHVDMICTPQCSVIKRSPRSTYES